MPMPRYSSTRLRERVAALLVGLALIWPASARAQTRLRFPEVFDNLTWRPVEFAKPLASAPLVKDVRSAADGLPRRLPNASLRAIERKPGENLRIGSKQVPVADASWWKHFEGERQLSVDILEFADAKAADRVFSQRMQAHSGTVYPDFFVFMSYGETERTDAVGALVRRDRFLFNIGFPMPFDLREARGGDAAKLQALNDAVTQLQVVMEALMRQVIEPQALADVASGPVTDEERRIRRLAGFARLWSEVKYNFVFLSQRPELNWDALLEKYMARVSAAKSQDEYRRILAEAMALLRDGHTSLTGGTFDDRPGIRLEPVGGRPVVTAVGNIPELRDSGLAPGMELLAVDGRPVDEVLKRDVYPIVPASTPQSRNVIAFYSLLDGEPGSRLTATFLDLQGNKRTFDLTRDASKHEKVFPSRPMVEFRELPGGIVYLALNTFGNAKVPARFDQYFDKILSAKGVILDVRRNGGGSSENGYAVIARLIAQATDQTFGAHPRLQTDRAGARQGRGMVRISAGPASNRAATSLISARWLC